MHQGMLGKLLLSAMFALLLSACGGSSGGVNGSGDSDGGDNPGATPGDGDGGDGRTDVNLKLGLGTGNNFIDQRLQVSNEELAAGAETSLLVQIVDANQSNALYANPVSIVFTSTCSTNAKAEFVGGSEIEVSGGSASVMYKDLGCGVFGGKEDTLSAVISAIDGNAVSGSATASGTVTIAAPIAADIQFVEASPETLRLNLGQSSEVKSNIQFKVVSEDGLPIVGQPVRFKVMTELGDVKLSVNQVSTDTNGIASVELQSGNVVGSAIVLAEIDVLNTDGTVKEGEFIYRESSEIVIQSGLPTQDNFLLTVPAFNLRTYDIVGTTIPITARLSDMWNRAVPDGTKVYFTSDKNGRILNSPCTIQNGSCVVEWESGRSDGYTDDHVITIMARTAGEAIIHDTNSNKVWDLGESYSRLSEPYLDADDNGTYNADKDTYEDLNADKKFNDENDFGEVYRGAACSPAALQAEPVPDENVKHCGTWANIWKTVRLVNSSGGAASINVMQGDREVAPGGKIIVPQETSITVEITDSNGNIPPATTPISVKAENGTVVSGDNIAAIPGNQLITTGEGFKFTVGLRPDGTDSTGDLIIEVSNLDGSITRNIYTIDDAQDGVITPVSLGLANLQAKNNDLEPNQSTEISVNVIDTANGNSLYTENARVEFSSTCMALGKASFSKTSVDTSTGTAKTIYTDNGCGIIDGKSDTVTATLIADNAPSDTVILNVLPAQIGSLESNGANNNELALAAFATPDKPNATNVSFTLTDKRGEPIADRQVKFVLAGNAGGAHLSYDMAFTDATGIVTARLLSGRLPGSVNVKATVKTVDVNGSVSGERSAFSEKINIFSRLPVDGKLLLDAQVKNPRAYDETGQTVEIEVLVKDRDNFKVDDGTIVHFRTDDNGDIDDQCTTDNGVCTVNWRSARTSDNDFKITIMARTSGEVDFADANNNNLYDVGESFEALSEAYLDANDNGVYNEGIDDLVDANNDSQLTLHNPNDGDNSDDKYRGVACSATALEAGHCAELADVWETVVLSNGDGGPTAIVLSQDGSELPLNTRISVSGTEKFSVEVKDRNGNLPPIGTQISIETNNGEIVSGLTNIDVPSLYKEPNYGYVFDFSVKEDGTPSDGQLIIQVTSLDGSITRHSYTLNDGIDDSDEQVEIAVGKLDGGLFTEGEATLAIGNGAILSSNGSTTVTADIVNTADNDSRYTKLSDVIFTSLCAQQGKAEFSPATAQVIGVARSTYKDLGCAQDSSSNVSDDIQVIVVEKDAQGNTNEVLSTAVAALEIAPPEVGSIEFVSAEPQSISLKGLGNSAVLPEISRVTFKVLDKTGDPMSGRTVNFTLSHELSGVELTQTSVASDADGLASVQLLSGRTHGSVSVKAELPDANGISTNSAPVTITTGLPTQKSMTLSLDKNNIRAWEFSGETATVTARVADQYGNWVPDGTSIVFATEGGSIDDKCTTADGECSVQWKGQNLLPIDGIATIIARMEGVAYFQDLNDNGWFDEGEAYDTFGEAYLDADDSGTYNPQDTYQAVVDIDGVTPAEFGWDPAVLNERERPFDFNNNGVLDAKTTGADKRYQGVACTDVAKAAGHCASRFEVQAQARIIMGNGGEPNIEGPFLWNDALGRYDTSAVESCVDVSYSSKSVAWRVSDSLERRNKLPGGTGISFASDQIKINEESGAGVVAGFLNVPSPPTAGNAQHKYDYLNSRGHLVWANIIREDEIDSPDGRFSMSVNTLSGVTYSSYIRAGITGDNAPIYEDDVRVTSLDVSGGDTTVYMKLFDACARSFEDGTTFIIRTKNGELSSAGDDQVEVESSKRLNVTIKPGNLDSYGYNELRFTIGTDGDSNILGNALEIYGRNGKIADYQIAD